MGNIDAYRDEINKWADLWDKAQEEQDFKSVERSIPSKQMSDQDFFGQQKTAPSDDIADPDAQYWNDVYNITRSKYDDIEIDDGILTEAQKIKADMAKLVASAPNPIRHSTIGKDQGDTEDGPIDPKSIGQTFEPEDIDELSELKIKLHDLQDKLNNLDGMGKDSSKLTPQIKNLKEKIDELSSALSSPEYGIDSQGD